MNRIHHIPRTHIHPPDNCSLCHRSHRLDMPCPKRLADALTMKPQGLENLTQADKDWLSSNKPDVPAILEEHLAGLL